jgi:hypothetical protein
LNIVIFLAFVSGDGMSKKKGQKGEEIIDGEIINDEVIIDMAESSPGKFVPVVTRKIQPQILPEIPIQRHQGLRGFQGYPPGYGAGGSKMKQLLDGFIMGMDIVERLLDRVDMAKRRRK